MDIQRRLKALREEAYGDFQSGLIPQMERDRILGVRIPVLRKLAKELSKEEREAFLQTCPHVYYEEDLLHAILLEQVPYPSILEYLEDFLPYVDNWAVSDILKPRSLKKEKEVFLQAIKMACVVWYTKRFAIKMLKD